MRSASDADPAGVGLRYPRQPPPAGRDFLIVAAAEEAGGDVILWFVDKDLRVICEHTGQPYEDEPKP
jgi:hypothetical protein